MCGATGRAYHNALRKIVEDGGLQDKGLSPDHSIWQRGLYEEWLEGPEACGRSKPKAILSCAEHPSFPLSDGVRHSNCDIPISFGTERKMLS